MRIIAVRTALACALLFPAPIAVLTSCGALAQTVASPSTSPDSADQSLSQRPLTDMQVQNFIAAQKPVRAIIDNLAEDKRDTPDPQTQAALEKIATQFGFKDYADFNDVGENIEFIVQGFDADKKVYVGQEALIKSEIAEVSADGTTKPDDKAEALSQLRDSLKQINPVKYPDNIKLVTKHYAELSEAFSD